MDHINEDSCHSMCLKCPSPAHTRFQMVTPLVNRCTDDVLIEVKPSLHQAFSQVDDVINLCFIHAMLYNSQMSKFKAHDDPGPL